MPVTTHKQSALVTLCATVVFVLSLFGTETLLSRLVTTPDFNTNDVTTRMLSPYFPVVSEPRHTKGVVADFNGETGVVYVNIPTPQNAQPSQLRLQTTAKTRITLTIAEKNTAGAFNYWAIGDTKQPRDVMLHTGAKVSITYTITKDGYLRATYIDIWESQT